MQRPPSLPNCSPAKDRGAGGQLPPIHPPRRSDSASGERRPPQPCAGADHGTRERAEVGVLARVAAVLPQERAVVVREAGGNADDLSEREEQGNRSTEGTAVCVELLACFLNKQSKRLLN